MNNHSSGHERNSADIISSDSFEQYRFRYFVIWISVLIRNSGFIIRHFQTKNVYFLAYSSNRLLVWLRLDRSMVHSFHE